MRALRLTLVAAALLLLAGPSGARAQTPGQPPAATEAVDARTWLGRAEEIETYLKQVQVVSLDQIPIGVTKPQRPELPPGGPVDAFAWKPIAPGTYQGFWESYKAEVAAYELDKLLNLDMVPVTVEREVDGERGAAAMWVAPAQSFDDLGGRPTAIPREYRRQWNHQNRSAVMFDNLICNTDSNLGNWLIDPAWNIILIDHSRAFTTDTTMVHPMDRVIRALWVRMQALTEESLTAALGAWLNAEEIGAILERRDRMADEVAKLVETKGESGAFR